MTEPQTAKPRFINRDGQVVIRNTGKPAPITGRPSTSSPAPSAAFAERAISLQPQPVAIVLTPTMKTPDDGPPIPAPQ